MSFVADITNAYANIPGITKQEVGIDGFTAYAEVSGDLTYKSEVTKSYVEDGSTVSDHIILRPREVRIRGSVADVFARSSVALDLYVRARSNIGSVTKYLPARTTAQLNQVDLLATDVFNTVNAIDAAIQDGANLVKDFLPGVLSHREAFVRNIEIIHNSKLLIPIYVGYTVLENMRITSAVISQDNITEEIVFTLTLEEVRTASTTFSNVTEFFAAPSPGTQGKTESVVEKGKQRGSAPSASLAKRVTRAAGRLLQ